MIEQPFPQELLERIRSEHGTPVYVYSRPQLESAAHEVLAFPNAFGLTARYAMKANPTAAILRMFYEMGLHFDASSGFEVRRMLRLGIEGRRISLSTQELPDDFEELLDAGISINACSLSQLERIGEARPGLAVGLRFNPGEGSGGNRKTNTGGPESSFGIWHELLPRVQELVERYDLNVFRIHTHIGSGSDPAKWVEISQQTLRMVRSFPTVTSVNLGGGYKVARVESEKTTDLQAIGAPVADVFRAFAEETGQHLHLEIEPGTFLVARAGYLLSSIQDVVTTRGVQQMEPISQGDPSAGYDFIKLDSGMTDLLRPSLYGSQHPMWHFGKGGGTARDYVVVGHCCESGDLVTPAPGEPEVLTSRRFDEAKIGDLMLIGGCGAYVSSMATLNYNSFPVAPEVLVGADGSIQLIRKRQPVEQIWENEVI